ncbi:MAG TPA: flagellar M-ring protein FliF C-terminal domain-containing protein [Candidatus Marinimicrobia bacterium]|nr:flagellar M-ring protein FliF C-terminal domain-containing protein [Candidatus Neomarinimicrobiota bacterium]HRS51995.1 flagellar M-ring protein FliF C-terminal domain-containing protein [Candidatus Neomarinimicrobiota bacterium]HRU91876.1 flagellar M-ring protein FliF C-terminal domain-containing protein [Candidatus Neomarinimicrobiota bacterium]
MSHLKVKKLIVIFSLGLFTILNAQENQLSYLSQKMSLENNIRDRINEVLEKLLDDVKFVVDVKAEIDFTPVEQAEPTETAKPIIETPPSGPTSQEPRPKAPEYVLPLPGFDIPPSVIQSQQRTPSQTQLEALPQATGAAKSTSATGKKAAPSIPVIKRQEISVILEDGVSPEIIENVRQVVAVAAHYDRARGDVISIMTATFKKSPGKDATETVILKNIAEKIDDIERRQTTAEYNARLEQQKQLERQSIIRDSLKIDELKKQIAELQAQLQTPQITEDQRQVTERQATARETELENLREQLRESNRRLQELELSSLETTPPSMFGIRNYGMWYAIIAAVILLIILVIVLLVNHHKQVKRQELEWGYGSKIPMGPRPTQPILTRQPEETPKPQPPVTPVTQPVAPPPIAPAEAPQPIQPAAPAAPATPQVNLEAQKEEMKSMRQSVISMSVGQPETALRIINAWISQDIQPGESETES